jgi:hypothetical protein
MMLLPAFSQGHAGAYAQQAPQKTTYTGDLVIAGYVVNPDKVSDYEKVIQMLKDSLMKSQRPEAKQQLAGWKVMRNAAPQPDGGIVYIHVITPVKEADYSITNLVYDAVTDPVARNEFYNLYRGALKMPLFVIQGPLTADFSK